MRTGRKTMFVVLALLAGLLGAGAAQAQSGVSFVPALGSPFPLSPASGPIAVGDMDRNGTVDVVGGGLYLYRGDGTGRLLPGASIASTGPVSALAHGDVNGDTLVDFVAVVDGEPERLVALNALPTGGYVEEELLADADDVSDVEVVNLDGDARADVVIGERHGGSNITVLRSPFGTGPEESYSVDYSQIEDLAVGDISGDGVPDVVAVGGDDSIAFLYGSPGDTFGSSVKGFPPGVSSLQRVVLERLDGDGRLDAAVADFGGPGPAALMTFRSNFMSYLVPVSRYETLGALNAPPLSIDTADFDGDGNADVVAGGSFGRFTVLRGDGAAGIVPAEGSPFTVFGAQGTFDHIAAVDVNHDVQPDVVASNGSAHVMLNSATGLLQPEPAEVRFGRLPAGSAPRHGAITLRSVRGRLRITRVELQGTRSFAVDQHGCVGRTLLLGQSCSMAVVYTPARRAAPQRALLSIDANAAAVVVPLSGTPHAPVVSRVAVRPRAAMPGDPIELRYRLSDAARVRVLIQRAAVGRRVAGECVALRRSNAKRRRCTLWTTVATVSRRGRVGANVLLLRARAKGRPLALGDYRLSVSANDRFRNRSDERVARFKVAQAARRAK